MGAALGCRALSVAARSTAPIYAGACRGADVDEKMDGIRRSIGVRRNCTIRATVGDLKCPPMQIFLFPAG